MLGVPAGSFSAVFEGSLAAYACFAAGGRELAGKLAAISCPTLVMIGALDNGATPAMVARIAAAIPSASLSILPHARHMMPVELADEVNLVLRRFLLGGQE